MKRDPEMVLAILRTVEATAAGDAVSFAKLIEARGAAEVEEHIRIAIDGGLLQFGPRAANLSFAIQEKGYWLTWAGHDYLMAGR